MSNTQRRNNLKFGIGVIVFNPDEKVIARLLKYESYTKNIIIYDNSVDNNAVSEKISKLFKYYYKNGENNGMSGALNLIFNKSIEFDYDILLTMDQDSEFSNENIDLMLHKMTNERQNNTAIYCPNYRKLYFDKNTNKEIASQAKININENKNVLSCMTSGSFYKVKFLEGLLNLEDLFIGYVDQDICYNLISRGYKILMIGSISFDQRVGGEIKNNVINRLFKVLHHTNSRYYYMIRNNLYLQKKYKNNHQIVSELKKGIVRILFNIVFGEKDKFEKIEFSIYGMKDFKNGILGKISSRGAK